jgi:hypothetical protein
VRIKGVTGDYTAGTSGELAPIIAFECRGCEPIAWSPGEGLVAVSSSGQEFEDVGTHTKNNLCPLSAQGLMSAACSDLSDDWADIEDETSVPVAIYNVSGKFERSNEQVGKGGSTKKKKK